MRMWAIWAAALLLVGCKGKDEGGAPARPVAEAPGAAVPATTQPAAEPAPAKPEAPQREAAVKVEIKQLLGEYGDNEVRADNAFKGKLVQVTGLVGDVKKDITGGIYVTVGTGGMLEIPVVQCSISESEAGAASALSKGQRVTVRGRVSGLMMNVQVSDCEINPVMKLCKGLQAAVGAERCMVDKETGDANGLAFGKGSPAGAVLYCTAPSPKRSASEMYDEAVSKMNSNEGVVVAGSRKALCFAAFFSKDDKGKTLPVPDDMKAKAQAFFDTL
ncbi:MULTISPECIES: OB-fold protein [Sorangium]|uniref:OB-fold protein n=1 Tax=Sorangium TaxID=39643 RepID=UPI003D9C4763